MSHRFPPIAAPKKSRSQAQVRVVARPQVPGLPWVELAIGVALLILLRGV